MYAAIMCFPSLVTIAMMQDAAAPATPWLAGNSLAMGQRFYRKFRPLLALNSLSELPLVGPLSGAKPPLQF